MNRFFSKLDLRDIKIDPNSSRFPPDAEDEPEVENVHDNADTAASETAQTTSSTPEQTDDQDRGSQPGYQAPQPRTGYVPSWAQQANTASSYPPRDADVVAGNGTSRESAPVDPLDAVDTAPPVVQAEEIAVEVAAERGQGSGFAPYSATAATDVEFDVETTGNGHVEVLKVSARSRPSAVAGAIAGVVRESGRAEVQAIGAGATNQAVKAVAIARDYLRETGIEAICLPAFIDVTIENEDRTAIRLVVEPR
jgi:stage V sporulation protein S